jgi:3-hydroxyisobutyrate dehydrogenase-like beta-hydroxyacid dehydrogenase
MRASMAAARVVACTDRAQALAGANLVLSLVTADQAVAAAEANAGFLAPGAIWCDMNSVAPETKRTAATAVTAVGGRYVDVAVMAPVQPLALAVPLLVSGPACQDAVGRMSEIGFTNIRCVGTQIGRASAIKMIRSVMVKGIEALSAECFAAAEAAGVSEEVFASLDASEKSQPWRDRVRYNLERMHTHGLRRAAEMEESVKTLRGLGVVPVMTEGTVLRQREIGAFRLTRREEAA